MTVTAPPQHPAHGPARLRPGRPRRPAVAPGLALAVVLAGLGTAVAHVVPHIGPLLGPAVTALLLGLGLGSGLRRRTRTWARVEPRIGAGVDTAAKHVLQLSVVLLGTQLSLGEVARIGAGSLPVMFGTLAACLLGAALIGKLLGIDPELRLLIGCGTAICGASAIAAVSAVAKPRAAAISYALATIFCFNVVAVLLYPPLGHLLGLSQADFGLFAGTAVNDTSSVIAAAASYGSEASEHAVVVKLVRSLMIVPICLVLSLFLGRRDPGLREVPLRRRAVRLVPGFLVGFVLMAGLASTGLLSADLRHAGAVLAGFGIAVALAGIGLSTDVAALRRTGGRPFLLGAALWALVATTSLGIQLAT